mmetsp:Transcript_50424/g.105293  ORF Transcript_50424/g.105293 Transcript_50424/m.105293 type:complete len:330 (-) Transcript_50424:959-1948(-)
MQSVSDWSTASSFRHPYSQRGKSAKLNDDLGGYPTMSDHQPRDECRQNSFRLKPCDKDGNSLCAQPQFRSQTEPCISQLDSWRHFEEQTDAGRKSDVHLSSNRNSCSEETLGFQIKGPLVSENFHLSQGSLFEEYADKSDIDDLMVDIADDFDFQAPRAQHYSLHQGCYADQIPNSGATFGFKSRNDAPEMLFNALEQEGMPGSEERNVYDSYALLDLPTTSADSSGAPEGFEEESNAVISMRPQTRLFLRSPPVDGVEGSMTPRPTSVRTSSNLSPRGRNTTSLSPTLVAEMPSTPNMRALDAGLSIQAPSADYDLSFEGEEHFLHFK